MKGKFGITSKSLKILWVENPYVTKGHLPLIDNPLADTSTVAWLLVFQDFGISSPVNGVCNGSITTFLQTSPSISAERFLSLLFLVIANSPFGQDKACCKLKESPQT